ncbi:MAG: putative porin [Candidatus Omnitrophica bacterium]|nr:putative porin [Candidatus Omnitrophota bacterium]
MKKLLTIFAVAVIAALCIGISSSYAGEIDILLQKLVEKGVLTAGEAQQIGTETKEQVKADIAEGKFSSLPAWVQNTKLKGDFRLRYQRDHAQSSSSTTGSNNRDRARVRVRLGMDSKVNEKLKTGIGIATGLSDGSTDAARSTNATLENGNSKKAIALDYAYAEYSALPWLTLIGGKFKNPMWEPGDLMWDTDINPEGVAVKFSKKISSKTEVFVNTGALVIDEINTATRGKDPYILAIQPGVNFQVSDAVSLKGASSYFDTINARDLTLDGTAGTNTKNTGLTSLQYQYETIAPALELSMKEPLKKLKIDLPYLALFGEYVENLAHDVKIDNTGYMVGCKFGAEKVAKWADWQVRYNYSMLGKDAVLDILPDSDRYGGKTGMRAHEVMIDWGLGANTWLGFDFYNAWKFPGNFASSSNRTAPTWIYQFDWNMKF